MRIVKASEARQNFQDVIDSVYYKHDPIVIIKRKKPWIVVQPMDSLDEKTLQKVQQAIKKIQ
jgi:prevent-host-death family protein